MEPRFTSFADWFTARRSDLTRGGLWLAGNEPGRPDPAGFVGARLRILLCRLSPYDDVAASITHRLLLCAARAVSGVYVDLAFFPSEKDAAAMRRDGVPLWLATGCKRAPADFDVVGISLSVQQEAANLPLALQESGLRLDAAGRLADAAHPLVILGGHGAGSVPFIHGDAAGPGSGGLVDAVCLGDGVAWLQDFLRRLLANRAAGGDKTDFLLSLARELPGTYVPARVRHVVRENRLVAIKPLEPGLSLPVEFRQDPMETWLAEYDGAYIPLSDEELEETLPLSAGCAYRCRFCQTGWMRRGFSAAARDSLRAAALRFKAAMVPSDLNLLASDACSVPDLERIVDDLGPLFRQVSVKSLSVSSLVRRPDAFRLLRKLAKHEFTFGVEGVSARLRAYLGKPAAAGDLLRIVGNLADGGLRRLKLFFIATGLEEERDYEELAHLLKGIRAQVPACRIIASFMPLFHAPFTPLQFAPVRVLSPGTETALAARVREANGEFRWSAYPDEIALMDRLCRAGRAATPALVEASLRGGLRYGQRLDPDRIRELADVLPDDPDEKTPASVFPWSDLQAAADVDVLWASYRQACRALQDEPETVATGRVPPRAAPAPESRPAESDRLSFWIRLAPEQARHPDHVVVRGFFRDRFAGWSAGAAAYLGDPRLRRPPGTHGLALASAEFRRGTRPPAGIPAPAEMPDVREDSIWFGVEWATALPAEAVLKRLKEARVKFQTVRKGANRWHVVERTFRARTGIAALREGDGTTQLYTQGSPALLANGLAGLEGSAGAVRAALAKADAPCPACGGTAYRALATDGGGEAPACFDCLARPSVH